MNTDNIVLRWAEQSDAPFIAWGVCCALHRLPSPQMLEYIATHICNQETDILYSYRNTLLAFDGEKPVGLCLCYDGKGYHERRLKTFALFEADADMDLENAEDETSAGEYYIDSLAVLPEYRGRGIAQRLMSAQIQHAKDLGIPLTTLLVDPDNPPALRLYKALGFKDYCDCYAFGMTYKKMALPT